MKKFKTLVLLNFILFLYSCATIKDGFTNQKKDNSDEFLIEKKSPLVMPPDYSELPVPKTNKDINEQEKDNIKSIVTKSENNAKNSEKKQKLNTTLEESLLEKIKQN
tara:strand:- start:192 stop:512 length:321 start_codon:yes stop_codon:yes gene_type:complete